MTNYVVETEQLTKKYKEQTIVNKIHLKVKEGESFKEELQRAGIQETQIFQMQLVEKPE